jgi:hypothetical protein
MARGWESKSVASQIESAETPKIRSSRQDPDPKQLEALRQRDSLRLSRTRILRELEKSQNPRYRILLSKALAELETRLARAEEAAPS